MPSDAEIAKQAAENAPEVVKHIIPSLYMAAIAAAGGALSFYSKVKTGKVRAFNITEFVGEIVTSAIVGLVTFWICKGFGVNEWLTAAGVAISGHMGARAIFLLEKTLEKKADTWAGK